MIKEITKLDDDYIFAKYLINNYHYAKRTPSISRMFGYYEDYHLIGVVTFGKPASNSLCVGVCGKEHSKRVYELNRLVFKEQVKNAPSQLIGYALKQLKKDNLIIVSYADTGMYHNGYIYQATNWLYTGKTKERTDKYVEKGKHSRHYDNQNEHLRVVRTAKHRYVYLATNKTLRKELLNCLNYPIQEYPKDNSIHYVLGSEQKRTIYNKLTNEYYQD